MLSHLLMQELVVVVPLRFGGNEMLCEDGSFESKVKEWFSIFFCEEQLRYGIHSPKNLAPTAPTAPTAQT